MKARVNNRGGSRRLRSLVALTAICAIAAVSCASVETTSPPEIDVPLPIPQGADFSPELGEPPTEDDPCGARESFSPSSGLTAGDARSALIRDNTLTVGVDQTTYLMGFRDPETGSLEGFDIEIARAIADDIMGHRDNITFVTMTSDERESALQNGEVDIVVRTMTMNCARWENVLFSSEYFTAGQQLLVTRDSGIEDLSDLTNDHRVCSSPGSTSIDRLGATNAQPVAAPDWGDCMFMVQQGMVDAITTDNTILAGMAIQDPYLEVVGEPFSDEPYGVAVAQGNEDLVRYINGILEDMRDDGTWDDIYDEWLAEALGPAQAPQPQYRD
ncbi:glutamate ABC transporter substrate-binding protein [Natronoglycomyces albus]|uniref:Glutamate ABC transporter substrate-binding protein n=1 Tax=Natronoglycomyces albus TaxID=2811108 RepID=A0A895XSY9_9ACTN|nr:glutamate ABC transporter substrate-binding protein [Natronoglycomyces albus]QSB06375.1 glutamate ABC transporter substrate-binding protein [Natronoglycomyces albus]